ncbi:MAG: VapC toxin family PIN domain ribonuclease [Euzebyaceae bacterium]|nr:VapC toxin family PIN domain ribonuclease [Euzebyaceae bacterium]
MARTRGRTQAAPAQRLILDSGAVIAVSRHDVRGRAALAAAHEAGAEVSIPSVVVAETVRGTATDAPVNRIIKAVGEVSWADESIGRLAGALLGAGRSNATVDAVVVASAIGAGGGVILTGDPGDLEALAVDHPDVVIRSL